MPVYKESKKTRWQPLSEAPIAQAPSAGVQSPAPIAKPVVPVGPTVEKRWGSFMLGDAKDDQLLGGNWNKAYKIFSSDSQSAEEVYTKYIAKKGSGELKFALKATQRKRGQSNIGFEPAMSVRNMVFANGVLKVELQEAEPAEPAAPAEPVPAIANTSANKPESKASPKNVVSEDSDWDSTPPAAPGIPDEVGTFYVVTKPTGNSKLVDILFATNVTQIGMHFMGGLKKEDIVGIYKDASSAQAAAEKLLATQGTAPAGESREPKSAKTRLEGRISWNLLD